MRTLRKLLPTRLLSVVALGVISLAATATGLTLWALRDDAIKAAERDSRNIASILANQISRSVHEIDTVLGDVSRRAGELSTPRQFRAAFGRAELLEAMRQGISRLPQADFITVLDASGRTLSSTHPTAVGRDFSDRDYFQYLSTHDTAELRVSPPIVSRITGERILLVSRRLDGRSGAFFGTVTIGIKLDDFQRSYDSIGLVDGQTLLVLRRDGRVLARYPNPTIGGEVMPAVSPWYGLVAHGGGFFRSPGFFAAKGARLVAVRPLADYPLVVDVALQESTVLGTWRRRAALIGVATTLAVLCSLFLLRVLRSQFRRLAASQAELMQREGRLRAASAEAERAAQETRAAHERLRAAIEAIPEGIVIFDCEDRYLLWNRRFAELYADTGIEIEAGTRFEEVLRARLAKGQFPDAVGREEEWLAQRLARWRRPQSTFERRTAGDRWILEQDCRTPDGGCIGLRVDITELKQREASFRLLFEGNPVPMWVHDRESLRFLAVNAAAIEHYGYTREQFLSMSVLATRRADDWDAARQAATSDEDGSPSGRTWKHVKADGSVIDATVFARCLQYDGRPAKLVAAIDVTEAKQAENVVRRTQAFLDAVVENIPVSVVVKEARELRYVLLNRAYEKMLGIPHAEMLGKNAYDFFPPDEADLFMANDREALASRDKAVFEAHSLHTRANGLRLVTSTKAAIAAPTGEPEYLLTVVEDITERKQAEDRLRQAATVFASTHEGLMITDARGDIIAVNPSFTTITGFAEDEVIGRNPRMLQSGRQDGAFYAQMWSLLRTKGFWQGEIWNRRKDGDIYPELLTISAVRNEAGAVVNYIGAFTDITKSKQSELRLQHLAHHDPLTDLPNRLLLLSRLDEAIARAKATGRGGALLLLDLDRFKNVNDSLGHPAGDRLLVLVAERLRGCIVDPDIVARMGGDEFAVVLNEIADVGAAARVAQQIVERFRERFGLAGERDVYVGATIGVSLFPGDGAVADDLVQHADAALYRAKDNGRNTYCFYSAVLTRAADRRLHIEAELRRAIEHGEFVLHYQPVVSLADGRIVAVEALIRWPKANGELVPPAEFIPIAEETGLIVPIGDWVLRAACRQMKEWLAAGLALGTVAVNLSSCQFEDPGLDNRVRDALRAAGLSARYLELELTESALMKQGRDAADKLNALQHLGVRLSIDDFGTGYSSLAYLARFPIHKLKIDQNFVRNIPDDRASAEITATIIALAKNLNLEVVAEGVEADAQLDFIAAQGCNAAQGYLFSRPLPPGDLFALATSFTAAGGKARAARPL